MRSSKPSNRPGVFRSVRPLVLASTSPRRRELLERMGLEISVQGSDIEEVGGEGEAPGKLVERWATEKALSVARRCPESWVLAADTLVVWDGIVMGKPSTSRDASLMLQSLSGTTHQVVTGVCVVLGERRFSHFFSSWTRVRFKSLSAGEIEAYVATGEPLDKAGAYGIQGMGAFLVEGVEGSYTNVVGLPLCETLECLVQLGVIVPKEAM